MVEVLASCIGAVPERVAESGKFAAAGNSRTASFFAAYVALLQKDWLAADITSLWIPHGKHWTYKHLFRENKIFDEETDQCTIC